MELLFEIGLACFALHFVSVVTLRWQTTDEDALSDELFDLPLTAHESQRFLRLFRLRHCLPWRPIPDAVAESALSVKLSFLLARWSAVGLALAFMSFFVGAFVVV